MSGVQAEAVQSATEGTPQLAASADTSVAGAHGEDEVLEDEPQILRAALAREVRNNRIIQKQLTDAVKRIERLLSGQVGRGNTSMPPLTLEPHMRPSELPHQPMPETRDTVAATDVVMAPVMSSAKTESSATTSKATTDDMPADTGTVSDTTTAAPEVDHVPVLSSVLTEDIKQEIAPKKQKKQHDKSPVIEMSAASHDDEELPEDDDDEIPVNELIKNYQARLDASIDMIRNLRTD